MQSHTLQIQPCVWEGRIDFDLERCNGCGVCVDACCGSAIELQ